MTLRDLLAPSVLAVLLASSAGTSMAATTAERFRALFDELHAVATTCPGGLDSYGIAAEAQCFTVDEEFRVVRRAVEKEFIPENWPLAGWTTKRGYRARLVPGAAELFVVLFDPSQRTLAIVPHRPCAVDPGVHVAEEPGPYELPRPVEHRPPDVAGTQGVAILRAVVREDGSVGDVCYLHTEALVEGMQASVTRSVERWRYEPARLNAKPVPVYVVAWVSWSTTRN